MMVCCFWWHTIALKQMTMDNYNSELIGASCELSVPYRGYSYATVVEDYGNELLVQISSGKEITVYKDEVYFL